MAPVRLCLLVAIVVAAALPATGQGVALLSHRAIYDLTLALPSLGSGTASVRGRLVLEWSDACDGYTLSQQMHSETADDEGGTVSDFTMSTWELKNGEQFRFTSRHVEDREIDEVRGTATMGRADAGGRVEFSKPPGERLALPGGTLFPTAHTLLLIRKAADGANFVRAMVFDGSNNDGVMDSTAWIGKRLQAGTYKGVGASALASLASWPVRVAYHLPESPDAVPRYEVAYRMFENGVATDVILDYGDFALKGALLQLDHIKPGC